MHSCSFCVCHLQLKSCSRTLYCVAPHLRAVRTALLLITTFKRMSERCYERAARRCAGVDCHSSLDTHGNVVTPAKDPCNLFQRLRQHSKPMYKLRVNT